MARLPEAVIFGALELRAFSLADANEGFTAAIESLPEVQHWLWWAQEPFTEDSYVEFVRLQSENFNNDVEWRYFICDHATGGLVGGCSIDLVNSNAGNSANIGYWIRTSCTGRNLATQVARILTDVVCTFLPDITSVEIDMDVANTASARIPQKLGFTLLGEFDKAVRAPGHTGRGLSWLMSRADWKCGNSTFIKTR